jgi:nucleoside-diphosphate-sugar epimerase
MQKNDEQFWKEKRVFITGGASFIGSHLADALIQKGARIRIVDDLSSGSIENIQSLIDAKSVEFIQADLREQVVVRNAVRGMQHVFHLAADHGGRGYVDTHQAGPAANLYLDGLIFREALKANVEKVTFASSGCVYPNYLQTDVKEEVFLTEDLVKPPYDSDNMYGWAKLMGELTLQAYHREHGMKAASCRYFTVYGPRAKENHAVIALIAKAFVKQNPFEVWGDGTQVRNWTFVSDIVAGTVRAAERIDDGTAVNLGTMERIRVLDAIRMVMELSGHRADIKTLPDMPTGPYNRVADNSLAANLLQWSPKYSFAEGLRQTYDWYVSHKKVDQVRRILDQGGLIERKVSTT